MPENNIRWLCPECVKGLYPNKGKFTIEEISRATHVKKQFGREHMWIIIDDLSSESIIGTVDNDPVLPDSPKCGERVLVKVEEVEDIM